MTSVVFASAAEYDLNEAYRFIALNSSAAAETLLSRVETAVAKLAEMPLIGHQRRDVNDHRYRFFPVHPYLLAYQFVEPTLTIVRVLHGARNIPRIMEDRQ